MVAKMDLVDVGIMACDRLRPTCSERCIMRPPNIGLEPSRLLSGAIMSPWRAAQARR